MPRSRDVFGFWQGLLRVVGSFGDCPRCLAVCPVGNDYHAHLADLQKAIPERTPEKVALGKAYKEHAPSGADDRRPRRLEHPLGRAGRLQGHGGAADAGIQTAAARTRAGACRGRQIDGRDLQEPLTAADIKAKARELGADLVGIADGAALEANPPDPKDPRRPSDITELDGGRVIVLAKRLTRGVARIVPWNDRHKYYNDELAPHDARGSLARAGLLARGQRLSRRSSCRRPMSTRGATDGNPREHQTTLLSLPHAAVEAGLGTLGLNLQLLTPEYGPRVMLTAVLCSVDVECDRKMDAGALPRPVLRALPEGLPRRRGAGTGAATGRPATRYRSPHGFAKLTDHVDAIIASRTIRRAEGSCCAPRTASIFGRASCAAPASSPAAAAAPMFARSAPITRRC